MDHKPVQGSFVVQVLTDMAPTLYHLSPLAKIRHDSLTRIWSSAGGLSWQSMGTLAEARGPGNCALDADRRGPCL